MEGKQDKKGESKMLNLILRLFGLEVARVVVQKWPSKQADTKWGSRGFEREDR